MDPVRLAPVVTSSSIRQLQELASRLWPTGWHPGGLGWALARGQLAGEVVLATDDGVAVGWAGRGGHGPDELLAQVDPTRRDVADVLVDWITDGRRFSDLRIDVYDGDVTLGRSLVDAGFTPRPDLRVASMFRPAGLIGTELSPETRPIGRVSGVSSPGFAPGYVVRAVDQDETDARVRVHRDAWRPASMPWADPETVDPDAESSFTLDAYDDVRATWLYDQDLDLVAVAHDGSFAGCCIVWFDPRTGVGEIEPMGVAPDHRRRGVAGALCLEAAKRVEARGGHQLFINTLTPGEYPVRDGAYLKAGFEFVERGITYVRESEAV
ncbi:MAG: GNAT family N-acetyltransferase [Actinobacteria bacterium]|nr:GNAT family N-acetyltransferase [Actinomycetota bacterium]